jgi:hypothetical protein
MDMFIRTRNPVQYYETLFEILELHGAFLHGRFGSDLSDCSSNSIELVAKNMIRRDLSIFIVEMVLLYVSLSLS